MTAPYGLALLDGSSVGPFEVLLILAVVLILFGPQRLPEVARNVGRMLANFKRASDDLKGQVMRLDHEMEADDAPSKTQTLLPKNTLIVKPSEHSAPRLPITLVEPESGSTVIATTSATTSAKPDDGASA